MFFKVANLAQLSAFDEIIDVRSPAEFAEDHIPGAINCPVLDNEERIRVGTLYCQQSPFEARKVGAVLVARNIARHIETRFHDRPKSWRPLIYCWRGGQRSASMALIMGQIGWPAHQLEHGYKAYRHQVIDDLQRVPAGLDFRVLCGPTGSGKSRFLAALARNGHQVVDLEGIASHKGSVLGNLPDTPQPTQKRFETLLRQQLLKLSPSRPVYIEAESRTIGRLSLPSALLERMRTAPCLQLEVPMAERVRFLLRDYDYFIRDPGLLLPQIDRLKSLYPREQLEHWKNLIYEGQFPGLVAELLEYHYDPLYCRSTGKHFAQQDRAQVLRPINLSDDTLDQAAQLGYL
jgi:tRNA 2-selenouridine synthase